MNVVDDGRFSSSYGPPPNERYVTIRYVTCYCSSTNLLRTISEKVGHHHHYTLPEIVMEVENGPLDDHVPLQMVVSNFHDFFRECTSNNSDIPFFPHFPCAIHGSCPDSGLGDVSKPASDRP